MSHQYRLGIIVELLPTAMLLGTALFIALLAIVRPRSDVSVYRWLAVLGFAGALVASLIELYGMRLNNDGVGLVTFAGAILADRLDIYVDGVVCALGMLLSLGVSDAWREVHRRVPALYALLLGAAAGISLVVAEREMAALVTGVALLVVCLAGITALPKSQARPVEAALKQLVIVIAGVAVLLEGLALVYGATGSTDLARSRGAFSAGAGLEGLALALCLLGVCALLGAVPLHQWVVHAAEGLPGALAAAVLGLGGIGGAVALVRVTGSGFGAQMRPWIALASVVAAVATVHPAVMALRERDVRRLAGRLAVLQAGLLIAAALGSGLGGDGRPAGGLTALMLGAALFALATMTTFLACGALAGSGLSLELESLRGLGRRAPGEAISLTLGLAALAGLPPLAGFLARILIVQSVIAGGYAWVALVLVLTSVIAAVPVLRVISLVYVESGEEAVLTQGAPRIARLAIATAAILGVAATFLAQPLLAVASGGAVAVH